MHGGKTEGSDPPPLPLREAPFGAPPTPSAIKSKSVCVTVERIIKFKETPGCRACAGHSKTHSAESKKRFSELVSADRAEAAAKSAAKTESKERIPIVHTEGDEELARAIHASEHDKDPEIAVSAEDVAHEFDAAEAGSQLPQDPVPHFSMPRQRPPLHAKAESFQPKGGRGLPRFSRKVHCSSHHCAVFPGGRADNTHDGWFGSRPNRSLGDSWTGLTVFKLKPI